MMLPHENPSHPWRTRLHAFAVGQSKKIYEVKCFAAFPKAVCVMLKYEALNVGEPTRGYLLSLVHGVIST